jgi:hypothetical protein
MLVTWHMYHVNNGFFFLKKKLYMYINSKLANIYFLVFLEADYSDLKLHVCY